MQGPTCALDTTTRCESAEGDGYSMSLTPTNMMIVPTQTNPALLNEFAMVCTIDAVSANSQYSFLLFTPPHVSSLHSTVRGQPPSRQASPKTNAVMVMALTQAALAAAIFHEMLSSRAVRSADSKTGKDDSIGRRVDGPSRDISCNFILSREKRNCWFFTSPLDIHKRRVHTDEMRKRDLTVPAPERNADPRIHCRRLEVMQSMCIDSLLAKPARFAILVLFLKSRVLDLAVLLMPPLPPSSAQRVGLPARGLPEGFFRQEQ